MQRKGLVDYRPGLKAGLISGVIWGALISLVQFLDVETSYSVLMSDYTQLIATNSTGISCSTPAQCISSALELNTAVALGLGVVMGAIIGLAFGWLAFRFLLKQNYEVKGSVISIFFWVLYEIAFFSPDVVQIATSLAISLFAGYLLGNLYGKFVGQHPNVSERDATSSSSRASASFSLNKLRDEGA